MSLDGEPEYQVRKIKEGAVLRFENPVGDSDLTRKVIMYIRNHEQMEVA